MATPSQRINGAVTIVVVVMLLLAVLDIFWLLRSIGSIAAGDRLSFVLLGLMDPAVLLLTAYGYRKKRKWSVILFGVYLVLGHLLLAQMKGTWLALPGLASVLVLLSMANQWRLGTLS